MKICGCSCFMFCDCEPRFSPQDAGDPPLNSRSDFTRLSSRDLYGTGSRLQSMAEELLDMGLIAAARHYFALAAVDFQFAQANETAGMGPKTGQSPLQSTVTL